MLNLKYLKKIFDKKKIKFLFILYIILNNTLI